MMLTQRLDVLAHDLAKQCQVVGQSKSEDKPSRNSFKKGPLHPVEDRDDKTTSKDGPGRLWD